MRLHLKRTVANILFNLPMQELRRFILWINSGVSLPVLVSTGFITRPAESFICNFAMLFINHVYEDVEKGARLKQKK